MLPDAWSGRFCVAPWPARRWNWRRAVAGSATGNQGAGMRSRSVPRSAYPNLVRLDHGFAARCRFGVARLRVFAVRFRVLPPPKRSLPRPASPSRRPSSSCQRPSFCLLAQGVVPFRRRSGPRRRLRWAACLHGAEQHRPRTSARLRTKACRRMKDRRRGQVLAGACCAVSGRTRP